MDANTVVQAFTLAREFIFGSNTAGLVTSSGSVVGGENPSLAADYLRGTGALFVGSGARQSTYVFPSATIAAWNSFITGAGG